MPVAGIARNSQLSNPYEVSQYRPFNNITNKDFSSPLIQLRWAGCHQYLWTQLIPEGMVK
jgi:hypothetical protein